MFYIEISSPKIQIIINIIILFFAPCKKAQLKCEDSRHCFSGFFRQFGAGFVSQVRPQAKVTDMFGWILKTDWDIGRMMKWHARRRGRISFREI